MYRRNIEQSLRLALADTPVILLNGARQTGKSTLALKLAKDVSAHYLTLDDATVLAAAVADPSGFVRTMQGMVIVDEVQKAPGLFPAIKVEVDADRRPGRFLLTGSANVLMLAKLAESLAGRMEIATLWPLSQGELLDRQERFIDAVFSARLPELEPLGEKRGDLLQQLTLGGYPEVIGRGTERRRQAWFASSVTTILQRDVRDLANIDGLTEMPRLLALLAARTGGLLNISELSRSSGIPNTTLKRYLSLLEATFLLATLPAWSTNVGKRLIKSPKVYLVDSGLTAYLVGQTAPRLSSESTIAGHLLEGFVVGELRKQRTWSETRAEMFHLRTTAGREVDVVLEDSLGRIVGIEVKATASVGKQDFLGLEALAEATGKRFVRGLVLYRGVKSVPFGVKYIALPVDALWRIF
jgi:predicted AAA+ superfamily ATPase